MAFIASTASARVADACSCSSPGVHELYAAASLPEGAGVSVWHLAPSDTVDGGPRTSPPMVSAVDQHGDAVRVEMSKPFEDVWFFAFPDATEGSTVELTSTAPGYGDDEPLFPIERQATVTVGPPVVPSDDLGMHVTVPLRRSWAADECSGPELSIVSAQVVPVLPPALQPFEDGIVTELLIDGDRAKSFFRGGCEPSTAAESRFGLEPQTVWALCEGNRPGVSEGAHELQLRAWLPGVATPWVSASQTIQLDCSAVEVERVTGTNGGSTDPDSDSGAAEVDGSTGGNGGPQASDAGCSTMRGEPAWWLLLLGFAVPRRRSRAKLSSMQGIQHGS